MPKLSLTLLAVSLNLLAAEPTASTASPQPAAAPLATDAILLHWRHDVSSPRLTALATRGHALADAAAALCDRTTQDRLDTTRSAWVDTFIAWRAAQALPLDPSLSHAIDPGPAELRTIESAVRSTVDDQSVPDNAAPSATGLKALEYLYWGNDLPKAQLGRLIFRRRCAFSEALSTKLAQELDAAAARPPATVVDYLTQFSATLRQLQANRLAQLGVDQDKSPLRTEFDGWRSQQTKAALLSAIDTIEAALVGPAKDGENVIDALNAAGKADLAQAVQAALAEIHAETDKLPRDIAAYFTRHPDNAQALLAALAHIQGLIDGPLTTALVQPH
jgi:hypothetical protein